MKRQEYILNKINTVKTEQKTSVYRILNLFSFNEIMSLNVYSRKEANCRPSVV